MAGGLALGRQPIFNEGVARPMTSSSLLRVTDLHKSFGALEVLRGVSFSVSAGERVAIIGPSGSGKSTCLRAVNYLEPPTQGRIELKGSVIGEREVTPGVWRRMTDAELAPQRAQIGMVFQLFYLWPHLTTRENVALQPEKVAGLSRNEALELADAMLAKVHMTHKAHEYPERLSGGQQQRVAIARALAQQPALILFDEPTSALDPELVGEVLGVIQELADEGRSMILVTHETRFARDVADRVLFMDQGLIVEQGPSTEVLSNPQSERLQSFLRQMHRQDRA
jgi:polar amino acid transport system ATP-binding protein